MHNLDSLPVVRKTSRENEEFEVAKFIVNTRKAWWVKWSGVFWDSYNKEIYCSTPSTNCMVGQVWLHCG